MAEPNIIAGKYRIEAKLGAGGMGTVYRATRLLIDDEVAIKVLHADQKDPTASDRFQREARAAARLKHANVVTIHDFGITGEGLQYLVMELVEGESLRRMIKRQGFLAPPAAVEIINQVCAALDDAHQHYVIHRDIKPDNIIISTTANGFRVKVLDFGIAKLRDEIAGNLTQTGSIVGTPHYMSPEQCLGEELDSRSDIYSLGIVAYEMLTGVVPFNSPSHSAVVVQHVTQSPPSLRSLNPNISPAVESIVLSALNKQRDFRPLSAVSFATNLSLAVSGGAFPVIGSVQPTQPNTEVIKHNETTVVLPKNSGAVSPSLTGGTQRRKMKAFAYVGIAVAALLIGGVIVFFITNDKGNGQRETGPEVSATKPLSFRSTSSSVRLPIQTNTYDAINAADGRRNTAWVEGSNGPGIGEWIQFEFDREIILHRVIVQPGYFKTLQIWKLNNRVAAARVEFSDGSSRELTFTDSMEGQAKSVDAVKTRWVRIVIQSVYPGTNPGPYDDTGISDVLFEWEPGK